MRYNKTNRRIELGSGTNRRQLFNLSQAKSYMQTVLVASGCKHLIEQGKTTSMRGLYYLLKHSIEGTKEETFDDQGECDPVIEDVEVGLNSLREELHLYASNRGNLVGPLTVSIDSRRRDRLRPHGLRRLQHSVDRRERRDRVQQVHAPSSSCTSKKTPSGAASTRTSSGASTTASSRTAADSLRAACGACSTACTTS